MEKLLLRLSPVARVRLGWVLIAAAFACAAIYFAFDWPTAAWLPAVILPALGGPILGSEWRRRRDEQQQEGNATDR